MIRWHKNNDDWRVTRKLIHDKYYAYKKGDFVAPVSVVSSLVNGLTGMMAILYGDGNYLKTVGIATSAGYDCDNQAATTGGLIGVLLGMSGIGEEAVEQMTTMPKWYDWDKPFNDMYVNMTRDEIALRTPISEIVQRTVAIAEDAIRANGGRMELRGQEIVYIIASDVP